MPEESSLNRFEISPAGRLSNGSLSKTSGSDILSERILLLYFPGIEILLDTRSHILQHHRDTSNQIRGYTPPSREKCDADISQMGDMLVTQSVSTSLEVRSTQSEPLRRFELRVVPDFCDYCLEVLDRLTKH